MSSGEYPHARQQRIAAEIEGLRELAAANPDIISFTDSASFLEHRILVDLKQTPAPFLRTGRLEWRTDHRITILFGRLFPAVPFEPYIDDAPLHPNISPDDGFICLWEEFEPRRSVVDGIIALRNILTWQTFNPLEAHLMQPEALGFPDRIELQSAPECPKLKLQETGRDPGVVRAGRIHRIDI